MASTGQPYWKGGGYSRKLVLTDSYREKASGIGHPGKGTRAFMKFKEMALGSAKLCMPIVRVQIRGYAK